MTKRWGVAFHRFLPEQEIWIEQIPTQNSNPQGFGDIAPQREVPWHLEKIQPEQCANLELLWPLIIDNVLNQFGGYRDVFLIFPLHSLPACEYQTMPAFPRRHLSLPVDQEIGERQSEPLVAPYVAQWVQILSRMHPSHVAK